MTYSINIKIRKTIHITTEIAYFLQEHLKAISDWLDQIIFGNLFQLLAQA